MAQERGWPRTAKVVAVLVCAVTVGPVVFVSPVLAVLLAAVYWACVYAYLARRYGPRRTAVERRKEEDARERYMRWFLRWFLPPIAVLVLLLGLADIGPEWQAAHRIGRPGTVTLTRHECGKQSCNWFGDFASDWGQDIRKDVYVRWDPPGARVGLAVRALDTGERAGVYGFAGEGGWHYWWISAWSIAGSMGYLLLWLLWASGAGGRLASVAGGRITAMLEARAARDSGRVDPTDLIRSAIAGAEEARQSHGSLMVPAKPTAGSTGRSVFR
ncbi:hypothetical protein [Hamadaea tsunoensis]|uniref:hypothetical protein n=1 Tax=Hamadaea tsunoensis TaxID=53368 RepID=UPI000411356E|nr:hypothetical protein [Hamadaea tsunoensis]